MSERINVVDLSHDNVINHHPDLVSREVAVEEEAANIAREVVQKAIDTRGLVDASPTAKKSLKGCIMATASRIDLWLDSQLTARRKSPVVSHVEILTSEQLAYIVARELLNTAARGTMGFTGACVRVGEAVRRVVEYALFSEANPGMAAKIEKQLSSSSSGQHSQAVFRAVMRSTDFDALKWEAEQKAAVGHVLISAFVDGTQLFERVSSTANNKTSVQLVPTPTMGILLAEADIFDALLMPYHYPMVIPPKPWTDIYDGGYINQKQHALTLVKTKSQRHLNQLEAADMDDVAAAVNTIQATPWRINLEILEVMRALHADGAGQAGLASSKEPDLPAKPWPDMDKEAWSKWKEDDQNVETLKVWKKEATSAYQVRTKWASKRLVQQQQIKLGERFAEEPAIYFPHTVDFRGRIYPAAGLGAINPQGNDAGKGLLEFAKGKPLGPDGARWLAIHTANCWGADKISLLDRELWALSNSYWLEDCGRDPLVYTKWQEADKPFQFLAACMEWLGYMSQGEAYVSHLPIAMDGSCSGLQHFAAMLRDEKTAESVNVVQTGDKPNDVYSVVLESVKRSVGSEEASAMASEWLDRLHRNVVKQPVMTTPYGVTHSGIVRQIGANTQKLIDKGTIQPFSVPVQDAAIWLAPFVSTAIGSEVAAAGKAMDWLKAVANIAGKAGCRLYWETPIGFVAVQDYRKTHGRRLVVSWAGQRQQLTVQRMGQKLDLGKQTSGMAPNYVHSMDACHLMVTVNNCLDHGIKDFAMVHDSFACHACDTDVMNAVLRECFIAMYSGDVLRELSAQLVDQLPAEVAESLPPPPWAGTLDLERVRDSSFFFA